MQLTDADISEFQACWKDEFGEEITTDRARLEATRLLELYAALFSPDESITGRPQGGEQAHNDA